jgi:hypothetical protein
MQWEYKIARFAGSDAQIQQLLAGAGEDRWELCWYAIEAPGPLDGSVFVFKRPLNVEAERYIPEFLMNDIA